MKKPCLILALFSIMVGRVYSQSFNVGLSGGYCLPIATDFHTVNSISFQNVGFPQYYTTFQSIKPASYGQGGNMALSLDWYSKSNIGCGLKLNALFSAQSFYSNNTTYLSGPTVNFNYTETPFSFQFIPHVNFKHDFKVVSPVLEMGMLIGITSIKLDYVATSNAGDMEVSSVNFHGGIMLGFYSSLGLAFRVTRLIRITLAVNCTAASYSASDWERTSFTVNGVDRLNGLPVSDKQGIFVKELDLTATQNPNVPHEELKFSTPFSNVGINAGITFVFAKKKGKVNDKAVQEDVHQF